MDRGNSVRGDRRVVRLLGIAAFALALCSACGKLPIASHRESLAAAAQCPDAIGDTAVAGKAPLSTTQGSVVTASGTIPYTATAGYLPLYAQGQTSGPIRACLFFFAYSRNDRAGQTGWPVTFLFNGGPGSPSDWLHLGGLGPKKMDFGPEGLNSTSSSLVDDADTLLSATDMVFVDPIGTGYSRPAAGIDNAEFDGLTQDADSIGDFIKSYLTQYNRMASPKYIIGESYGGMRLPVLSRYLEEQLGIQVAGITFISPWLDAIGDQVFGNRDVADDLPYLGYLPEYTTAAWYHGLLAPDLQAKSLEQVYEESQTFADTDYLEALAAGDELPDPQRTQIIAQLSRLTSLAPSYFLANNLRVTVDQFRVQLLRSKGQTISYYDGRLGAALADPVNQDPYDIFDGLFDAADKAYFGGVLGVTTDLSYASNNWTSWPGANPGGAIQGAYLTVLADLSLLLFDDPQTKVYIASGLYDLECPAAEVEYLIRHLNPQVAQRIQIGHYPGGHPIYFSDAAHSQFSAAMAAFLTPTPETKTLAGR